jgi:Zn-dependent alcohol dehydrogenase
LWLRPTSYHPLLVQRGDLLVQHKVRGVVSRKKGAPVEVLDILVPVPGPGEALVEVQACGVCHTDLHNREGGIGAEFPYLLGHETARVVEAVWSGVTHVRPGDFDIRGSVRPEQGNRGRAGSRRQHGGIDLDAFVTERIALDKVETAFERMHNGEVLRSVVVL